MHQVRCHGRRDCHLPYVAPALPFSSAANFAPLSFAPNDAFPPYISTTVVFRLHPAQLYPDGGSCGFWALS